MTVPLKAVVETADVDVAETAAPKTVQRHQNKLPTHHVRNAPLKAPKHPALLPLRPLKIRKGAVIDVDETAVARRRARVRKDNRSKRHQRTSTRRNQNHNRNVRNAKTARSVVVKAIATSVVNSRKKTLHSRKRRRNAPRVDPFFSVAARAAA